MVKYTEMFTKDGGSALWLRLIWPWWRTRVDTHWVICLPICSENKFKNIISLEDGMPKSFSTVICIFLHLARLLGFSFFFLKQKCLFNATKQHEVNQTYKLFHCSQCALKKCINQVMHFKNCSESSPSWIYTPESGISIYVMIWDRQWISFISYKNLWMLWMEIPLQYVTENKQMHQLIYHVNKLNI